MADCWCARWWWWWSRRRRRLHLHLHFRHKKSSLASTSCSSLKVVVLFILMFSSDKISYEMTLLDVRRWLRIWWRWGRWKRRSWSCENRFSWMLMRGETQPEEGVVECLAVYSFRKKEWDWTWYYCFWNMLYGIHRVLIQIYGLSSVYDNCLYT